MRKLVAALILSLPSLAFAVSRQNEATYFEVTNKGDISVSNSAWTAVPATASINSARIAIQFDNYDTNNASMLLQITSTPVAPASLTEGFTCPPSSPPWEWTITGRLYLWAISLHSGAENLFYEELK